MSAGAEGALLGRAELERAVTLAGLAGIDSLDTALQVCTDFYPDEILSPRAMGVLRELFASG